MKKRHQDHTDQNILKKFDSRPIDKMHLPHYTGHPNPQKCDNFEDDHKCTSIDTFEFPMPIEEKNSQISNIS